MGWFSHDCKTEGHYYEGRYDEVLPPEFPRGVGKLTVNPLVETMAQVIDAFKSRIYVCDICRYCGNKIEREPAREPAPDTKPAAV